MTANRPQALFSFNGLAVRLRPAADVPLMARWLTDPRVLDYYEGRDHPFDEAMVRAEFLVVDETTKCIVGFDGAPIGHIQYYPLEMEERKEYGYSQTEVIYGIDLFIGEPELWGQGIGTRLVEATWTTWGANFTLNGWWSTLTLITRAQFAATRRRGSTR